MKKAKFFIPFILAICSYSTGAFSDVTERVRNGPIGPISGIKTGTYAAFGYDYNFFANTGNLTGSEDAEVTTAGVFLKGPTGIPTSDNPKYKPGLLAGVAAIGYRLNNSLRAEIEAGYWKINRDTTDYDKEGDAYYLELERGSESLCANQSCGPPPSQLVDATSIVDNTHLAFKLKNEYISNFSTMANLVYELRKGDAPLFFFLGVGAGMGYVDFLGTSDFHFAFQGKMGFGFEVMKNITFTIGYRYFSLGENTFTDRKPLVFISKYDKCVWNSTQCTSGTSGVKNDIVASTSANVTNPVGINAIELGIVLTF